MKRSSIISAAECALLAAAVFALLRYPAQAIDAAKSGVDICAQALIPSLFPFFTLSSLAVELGITDILARSLERVMRPLFNVSGACSAALILGFVGGYPVGAKTAAALYERGKCTRGEAERLLGWCNNSGPAFVLGVVGAGVFSSPAAGLRLYIAHALSALAVGVLFGLISRFRSHGPEREARRVRMTAARKKASLPAAFVSSVKSSFASVISICGFVIFFMVVIRLLFVSGAIPAAARLIAAPFGGSADTAERLLTGFIELSSGVWALRGGADMTQSVYMAAVMLGWAGLSVHCQVLSLAGESGLGVGWYLLGKALQAAISALIIIPLAGGVSAGAPAGAFSQAPRFSAAGRGLSAPGILCALTSLPLFAALLLFYLRRRKKCGKSLYKGV